MKNKYFSISNIAGLTLGFAGCIIISLFLIYEFSWDKSNANYERIYRVQRHSIKDVHAKDGSNISPHSYAITASMLEEYPEFEKVTVISENNGKYLSAELEKQVYDKTGICADHNFFDVFTYEFIKGNKENVLEEPFSIVLSESMADKLFKDENPLGKTVFFEKKIKLKVKGVYEDLPVNSSLRPSYIVSFSTLKRTGNVTRDKSWDGNCMNYVLLKPSVIPDEIKAKVKDLYANFEYHKFEKIQLCPLSKIHLSFNDRNDYYIVLFLYGLIGLFILAMSAFNYVNFTISNASTRGKEVAVRKVLGATRFSLFNQFQRDTILITLISIVLAFGLVEILLPFYNTFANSAVELSIISDWNVILIMVVIAIGIGFLSGSYPAIFMSSNKVIVLIKEGLFKTEKSKFNVRNGLVALQFTISIFLVCLSLFFNSQIDYMTNKDMGFRKENILYAVVNSSRTDVDFELFRNRLVDNPEIINASMSKNLPFVNFGGGMLNWEGAMPDEKINYRPNWVSFDFVKNMELEIIKGRDFSSDFKSDIGKACLINETALDCFGWEDPIGKRLNNNQYSVVGVVKDYHLRDMHNTIEPVVLYLSDGNIQGEWTFAFRYAEGSRDRVFNKLNKEFNTMFPDDPFEFSDVNTAFSNEQTFKIYQSIKKSIMFFTVFIILLAIMALLGMVSYVTMRRTKELGIRKINGSSIMNLFLLMNRDFFAILIISSLIALPLAYLGFDSLPGSYKIAPQFWVPIVSVLIITSIILITTGWQTWRAANRNPVEALRYE